MINFKKSISFFIATLFFFSLPALPSIVQAHIPIEQNDLTTLAPMLATATPAVVNVSVEKVVPKNSALGQQSVTKAIAVGSGVIINSKKGYIVTNAHIVKNQKVILITLKDGRRYHAKLIGKADGFDIAVIQINAKKLAQMPLANSSKLQVGDFVVAIGSPFNLSQTVTSGVISALNRTTPKIEGFQNFIQTDASINPGNSGGALINLKGQLVGINTAILAPNAGNIGIGFAIPSNMVKEVSSQLIQYGKVQPGILGVIAQNITPELASAMKLKSDKGVVITQVIEGSSAYKAGIKSEDVILKVNDYLIHSAAQLHNLMGITHPSTKIKIELLRNGNLSHLVATVGSPKEKLKQHTIPYLSGMRLQTFGDLEPNSTRINGVMVLDLTDESAGALAGIIPGDIIIKANGKDINSVSELISIASHIKDALLLKLIRGTQNLFLVIQPDQ